MEKEILISAIIPIYNVEKYLDRCVKSVQNQSFSDIEIILVDDGSPDNCPKMCDDYAKEDSRIKVIHKPNGGLGDARNSSLETARGEYIAFIDSDDFIEPDYFEKLYKTAKSDNYDTVKCLMTHSLESQKNHSEEKMTAYVGEERFKFLSQIVGWNYEGKDHFGMSACSGIYSAEIIKNNKMRFYSERKYLSEDVVFNIEFFIKAQRTAKIKYKGYHYCYNGESLTHSYNGKMFENAKNLYYLEMKLCENLPEKEELKNRIYSAFLGNVRSSIRQEVSKDGFRSRKAVKIIANDDLVSEVLNEYDYLKMSFKSKKFCEYLVKKNYFMLIVLTMFRNMERKKRTPFLRALLKMYKKLS